MTPCVGKTPYQDISELMPLRGSTFCFIQHTKCAVHWQEHGRRRRGDGTGGRTPRLKSLRGTPPPEIAIFTYIFKELIFYIIRDFQNKVAEI